MREEVERLVHMLGWPNDEAPWRATCEEACAALILLLARAETAERERDAARARAIEECAKACDFIEQESAGWIADLTASSIARARWQGRVDAAGEIAAAIRAPAAEPRHD